MGIYTLPWASANSSSVTIERRINVVTSSKKTFLMFVHVYFEISWKFKEKKISGSSIVPNKQN